MFRWPAEWEPHERCLTAWPDNRAEWGPHLEGARDAVEAMCRIIAATEPVELWVSDSSLDEVAARFDGVDVAVRRARYGDIWFRDTGPIVGRAGSGRVAVGFRWTGWGGKYVIEGDDEVAAAIAGVLDVPLRLAPLCAEPGGIDCNGAGIALTTRECLLNPNRNPGVDAETIENILAETLGIERLIWLDRGLANDHTDGHVDNLARFVAADRVAVAEPAAGDPNREVHAEIAAAVEAAGFDRVLVPSPGAVLDDSGALMPASHLNFYIANGSVAVPLYGGASDELALERLAAAFPDRQVAGFDARAMLAGGGAAHCITREIPR